MTINQEDRLDRIERLVEKNAEAIARHEKDLEKLVQAGESS